MSLDYQTPIYREEDDPLKKILEDYWRRCINAAKAETATMNTDPSLLTEEAKMGFCLAAGVEMEHTLEQGAFQFKTKQKVGFFRPDPKGPWRVAVGVPNGYVDAGAVLGQAVGEE